MPDTIGLIGVSLYLGSYFALQAGFVKGQTYLYASLNLAAASCVLIGLTTSFNLPSAIIQVAWIVISLVGISRLAIHDLRTRLNEEEQAFAAEKLPGEPRRYAHMLMRHGYWLDAPAGLILTREQEPVYALVYLATGAAEVEVRGRLVARCGPGAYVGELTALCGSDATATVIVSEPAHLFAIRAATLRRLCAKDERFLRAIERSLAHEMRRKIVAANARATKDDGGWSGDAAA